MQGGKLTLARSILANFLFLFPAHMFKLGMGIRSRYCVQTPLCALESGVCKQRFWRFKTKTHFMMSKSDRARAYGGLEMNTEAGVGW